MQPYQYKILRESRPHNNSWRNKDENFKYEYADEFGISSEHIKYSSLEILNFYQDIFREVIKTTGFRVI